jgi:hypothetical protein
MMEAIALLKDFGFTARDAPKIAERAYENNLTLADIQAWIDEARTSTSLNNPLGFVRARLQEGDRLPVPMLSDPHTTNRHRYVTQWAVRHGQLSVRTTPITQTCTCGRVTWADRFCEDCGLCSTCCKCPPEEINEE